MAVRSTMASLISRVRLLINDVAGSAQTFTDQQIQDTMDSTRQDTNYLSLRPYPTYNGASILYLDYYAEYGDWEDNATFWQYRTTQKTPSASEPIVGHWTFAVTTLPPVYLQGSTYDVYRTSADLLERLAAQWTMAYNVNVDGQSLQRAQVMPALLTLATSYRKKQRAHVISFTRSDVADTSSGRNSMNELDYMSSGDPGR